MAVHPRFLFKDLAMLFQLLLSSVTAIVNIILAFSILTRKIKWLTSIAIWVVTWFILTWGLVVLYLLGVKPSPVYYLLDIAALVASLIVFKEGVAQNLFVFFASWELASFFSALYKWITAWLPYGSWNGLVTLVLFIATYAILIPALRRYWRPAIREMLELFDREKPVYLFVTIAGFTVFTQLFSPATLEHQPLRLPLILTVQTLIFLIYYLLFSHFRVLYHRLETENEIRHMSQQLILQKRYYEEVDRGVLRNQRRIHDTRHNLVTIAVLVKEKNLEALEAYMDKLLEDAETTVSYCRNPVGNAVIGGYISIAENEGIDVSADIDLPDSIDIDVYELSILLGNALENGIEACRRIDPNSEAFAHRFLSIRTRVENDCLVIRIENTSPEVHSDVRGGFPSSKGSAGGIGLGSIRAIVDKYRGSLSLQRQENKFVLSAVLFMKDPLAVGPALPGAQPPLNRQ